MTPRALATFALQVGALLAAAWIASSALGERAPTPPPLPARFATGDDSMSDVVGAFDLAHDGRTLDLSLLAAPGTTTEATSLFSVLSTRDATVELRAQTLSAHVARCELRVGGATLDLASGDERALPLALHTGAPLAGGVRVALDGTAPEQGAPVTIALSIRAPAG